MGISGLTKFLRDTCPEVFTEINLSDLRYKKGAVDISLYVFKYKTIFGDKWMTALLNLVSRLRKLDVHCCFIYDTSAPEEKMIEREARREKRDKLDEKIEALNSALAKAYSTGVIDPILIELNNKISSSKQKRLLSGEPTSRGIDLEVLEVEIERISKQSVRIEEGDFENSKKMMSLLGVPFFNAAVEAETTCSDLCKQGKVDFVLSEDSDVLAYGAPMFVSKVNATTETATVVYYEEMLSALGLSTDSFLDFCIMCGTDYNPNIRLIGPKKAYKLISEYGSIEAISDSGIDVSVLNHIRVRDLFKGYKRFDGGIPFCEHPNIRELGEFLFKNNIGISIDTIKKNFSEPEILFE
jgi:5'-3' exonuclease